MYRIYDKLEKRWRPDIIVFQDGTFGQITSAKGGYTLVDSSGFVLVRPTGKTDRLKNVVYEFDKVSWWTGGAFGSGEEQVAIVTIDEHDQRITPFINRTTTRLGSSLEGV